MADFFKGLTGGFQSGLQLGEAMRAKQEREALAAIMQEKPTDAGPDFAGQFRMQGLEQGPMPQAEPIQDTQSFMGRQYAQGALTPDQITGLRYGAMADVIAQRDPAAALRMRQEQVRMQRESEMAPLQLEQLKGSIAGQEQQRALTGIQLSDAERKQKQQAAFDTGFAEINQQKFDKPEERTAAILSLVEKTQGVTAAEQLRASYSQNELNQISLQAKKFDEGFRQSRAKGVIPALEWFDEQNTSFKLERDPKNPFRVIQVNTDGSRTLFADAKNERELGMIIDAKAKPGGFLELAKFDLDQKKADDLAKYYRDVAGSRGATGLKQKVADFKEVYGRDPTEAEKGVLAGLVSKDPNKPEREFDPLKYTSTIKNITDSGLSPAAARIEADQLYGRGPAAAGIDAGLQKANAAKGAGTSAAPIEVQPGERYITAPGAAVRAPLDQFLRESRRGLFGGVEYFYTDPVTGRRYTTDEYNKLLTK